LGWFEEFRTLRHPEETIAWLHTKPYMGPALKLQVARDLGVADVAKPDIWLTRIAGRAGETVQGLCERLARETGESVGEVDLVLWYAAANGMIED